MKHNLKITFVLLAMFLITQLIGLAVIKLYEPIVEQVEVNGTLINVTTNPIPYGMQPTVAPEPIELTITLTLAFIIAILIVFFLTKMNMKLIMRLWFFIVVVIVMGITFNALLSRIINHSIIFDYGSQIAVPIAPLVSIILALPLAVYKIYKRNIVIHNLTELLIYPGIAVVFVALLAGLGSPYNIGITILILLAISVYDMWAVWHSGFMQKLAKFQMNELKVFGGFFVPYLTKKQKATLKELKTTKKISKNTKAMKVSLAILGGGDVVFPIITAGVIYRMLGLFPALIVVLCATLSLLGLFILAKKGKFYPAMPFLTTGLLVGIGLSFLYILV
ncbi:MAG: hypothetical protein WC533_00960 [Candidatus Pacearchaeota archaeon]